MVARMYQIVHGWSAPMTVPDASEFADECQETAVPQAFGDGAIVDPSFMPAVGTPVPDQLNDAGDGEYLQRHEDRFLVRGGDEGPAEGNQHRQR